MVSRHQRRRKNNSNNNGNNNGNNKIRTKHAGDDIINLLACCMLVAEAAPSMHLGENQMDVDMAGEDRQTDVGFGNPAVAAAVTLLRHQRAPQSQDKRFLFFHSLI